MKTLINKTDNSANMFCQKCGSVLLPRREGTKKTLACSCGYKTGEVGKTKLTESITNKRREVEVIEKEIETLPKTNVECPKCSHREAYYWTVQTRAGDEPETKFQRCIKCKHTWRDYD